MADSLYSMKGKQLMSFVNYVKSMGNNVDEITACKRYKEFMADLSQSKVSRFFEANKDREWFKLKYHPIESQTTLQQSNVSFLKRLNIFNSLDERNYFNNISYTAENITAILNLMDAIIVQLEDGPKELVDQLLENNDIKINNELRQQYVPIKPTSVVIDDISIETTIGDIRDVCTQASPELLRIAPLDPYYVEEGQLRRKVIAVYSHRVDIRDICWKLSRMKLNNRALSVSINKCLTNRVLTVDAISNHHLCITNDIRNAIVLILNFDELKGLSGKRKQSLEADAGLLDEDSKMEDSRLSNEQDKFNDVAPPSPPGSVKSVDDEDGEKTFDVNTLDEDREKSKKKLLEFKFNLEPSPYRLASKLSKNKSPVLEGAYLYLVEFLESTGARYHLSKVNKNLLDTETKEELARNDQDKLATIEMIVKNLPCSLSESTKYLDRLLWYLRIVHSFDYYNKTLYRQEDELTLRMGVVHVRDDPSRIASDISVEMIKDYLRKSDKEFEQFGQSQVQKYVTKDEERYNYKSYGKVITDELTSYAQKIQKPKSTDTEEAYKCRHCTRIFQKLVDIGRHFVSKHRWAIDAIELETDFFNAYLFDAVKINPCPPKELLDIPPNRFAKVTNFSQMGEDPELLQQTVEAYEKVKAIVKEPAPRAIIECDPRNDEIVDYTDISFDDAI